MGPSATPAAAQLHLTRAESSGACGTNAAVRVTLRRSASPQGQGRNPLPLCLRSKAQRVERATPPPNRPLATTYPKRASRGKGSAPWWPPPFRDIPHWHDGFSISGGQGKGPTLTQGLGIGRLLLGQDPPGSATPDKLRGGAAALPRRGLAPPRACWAAPLDKLDRFPMQEGFPE